MSSRFSISPCRCAGNAAGYAGRQQGGKGGLQDGHEAAGAQAASQTSIQSLQCTESSAILVCELLILNLTGALKVSPWNQRSGTVRSGWIFVFFGFYFPWQRIVLWLKSLDPDPDPYGTGTGILPNVLDPVQDSIMELMDPRHCLILVFFPDRQLRW